MRMSLILRSALEGRVSKDARRSIALGAALVACYATPAAAHGFGQRYDLPLPLSLYLFGTAAAVVLSFVVVALFARNKPGARGYPRLDLGSYPKLGAALQVITVGLFTLTVAAGLFGDQDPVFNIAPTMVWIIWWVGLAMFSAFLGDLWRLVNPWKNLFDAGSWVYRRLTGRGGLALGLAYPPGLGVWPAVGLLFAVSWTELVYPRPDVPANIAWFALLYSLVTWGGMALFGSAEWVRRGEVSGIFFGLFARFAPTEPSERGGLALRPFGAGLLANEPASRSMVAFVLLVLASVLYDGLLTTPEWAAAEHYSLLLVPLGEQGPALLRTLGLAGFWAVFLAAFLAVNWAMSRMAGRGSPSEMAQGFVLTLVPIAIAYHLAHYLTYLLNQGQFIIPLVSDPFGYDWNLFGTFGYRVDIAVVGARFAWYAAVISIVTGHIAAVYLADVRAHQILGNRAAAMRAQVPLTALMVVYTFVSLSILSEPIIERRTPAQPTAAASETVGIPADAVLPELGVGWLRPVGPGHAARLKLSYRVLGSAFHDGARTTEADLLYAYMFAYRWAGDGEAGAPHDPAVAAATAPLRQRLRAVKVTGVDATSKSFRVADVNFIRELFLVDVYLDMSPGDPEQDAVFAAPWSTLPWHLMVLMEEAVSRGWAAFSEDAAKQRGVEWLDLVRSEALKTRLATLVDQFEREGFRPATLEALVSEEAARKRWAALAAFYRGHGHYLVSNGPYQLKGWSAGSATLGAFRDLSYPLGVGSFDVYAIPRRGYITKIEREKAGLRLSADIEIVAKFMRDYEIDRQPMRAVDATVRNRAAPECRYMVLDAGGHAVLAGKALPEEDLTFAIPLDSRLSPGQYTVMAEILVNGNAVKPEVERIPVLIGE
jgi:hypothetical protein